MRARDPSSPTYVAVPVGYVRTTLTAPQDAPRQGRDEGLEAEIEVDEGYADALEGVGERERLLVICWLHLADRNRLSARPRRNRTRAARGVFATRSPMRPNPFAVYTVELLEVRGRRLRVRGIDAVEGTPVLDIRPHISRLDD